MPHKDPEKAKAYKKKYQAENKEKISAYKKAYVKKNKEQITAYQASYRLQHPYEKKPRIAREKKLPPVKTEWAKKRRELSREDFEQWQHDRRNRLAREKYARNKTIIDNYKLSHPCRCGEADIACLEFHHRDESTKKFAISAGKGESVKALEAEIAKCDILCKNCHTKLHNKDILEIDYNDILHKLISVLATKLDKLERRRHYRNKQKTLSRIYVRDYKIENNCKNCEEKDPNCLVFHHKIPAEKEGKIPQLLKYGIKRVKREIDKCDLLCHNCHSKTHHIENHPFKLAVA